VGVNGILLGGFLVVVVIQVVHRPAGAIAAVVWCLGLMGYGAWGLENGAQLGVLGARVESWQFFTFMSAMLAYNVWVLYRSVGSRRG
jgi:hypothetical protein